MRDAKPKLSFLNTLFDQSLLIREEIHLSLSSEDHTRTLKPSVSDPKMHHSFVETTCKERGHGEVKKWSEFLTRCSLFASKGCFSRVHK